MIIKTINIIKTIDFYHKIYYICIYNWEKNNILWKKMKI